MCRVIVFLSLVVLAAQFAEASTLYALAIPSSGGDKPVYFVSIDTTTGSTTQLATLGQAKDFLEVSSTAYDPSTGIYLWPSLFDGGFLDSAINWINVSALTQHRRHLGEDEGPALAVSLDSTTGLYFYVRPDVHAVDTCGLATFNITSNVTTVVTQRSIENCNAGTSIGGVSTYISQHQLFMFEPPYNATGPTYVYTIDSSTGESSTFTLTNGSQYLAITAVQDTGDVFGIIASNGNSGDLATINPLQPNQYKEFGSAIQYDIFTPNNGAIDQTNNLYVAVYATAENPVQYTVTTWDLSSGMQLSSQLVINVPYNYELVGIQVA